MRRTANVKRMLFGGDRKAKEHKRPIQTKEEKFIPFTKKIPKKDEPFSSESYSIKLLSEKLIDLSNDQLKGIIDSDERISAKKLAEKELTRREG